MIASAQPDRKPGLRGWLPLILAAGIYAVVTAAVVFVRTAGISDSDDYSAVRARTTSDFRDYWWTARRFRESGEITTEFGVHSYLPFFTIFMTPWSFLPLRVAIVVFSLLSVGLLALAVVMVEALLNDGLAARPRPATLITLGLMLAYVHSCAVLGAVGLLLMFLIVATWFLFERGREWEAGAALGLATLIKLLPALLILFFLLKRRWRVAGAAAAVCVVLGLGLPLLSLGYDETLARHAAFYDSAVREQSAWMTTTSDQPRKANYSNSSLPIVLRRLLSRTDSSPGGQSAPLFVNVADLPRAVILAVYAVLLVALLVASVAAALRPPVRAVESIDDQRALRAQFGVWCCAMLLAAPLLWIHYLPTAYWPLALVADQAERTRRARRRLSRWAVAAMLAWLAGAVLLAWPAARAAGAQLVPLACLWLVLVVCALRRSSQEPA